MFVAASKHSRNYSNPEIKRQKQTQRHYSLSISLSNHVFAENLLF